MGMTIEKCIEYMEIEYRYAVNEDDMADEEDIEVLKTVLETMRKYQKIEKILKGNFAYKLDLIEKVVKDGKID